MDETDPIDDDTVDDVGFVAPPLPPRKVVRWSLSACLAVCVSVAAHAGVLGWAWSFWSGDPSVGLRAGRVALTPNGTSLTVVDAQLAPIFLPRPEIPDEMNPSVTAAAPHDAVEPPAEPWTSHGTLALPDPVDEAPIGVVAAVTGSVHAPPRTWGREPAQETPPSGESGGDNGASAPVPMSGNLPPAYPRKALRERQEGITVVEAMIDETGRCVSVRVTTTSGSPLLDDAAAAAVKDWRFTPARSAGRPVPSIATVPVRFYLTHPEKPG